MFESVQYRRPVDRVADQLRSQVLSGALAIGSRLPPERALAAVFGVHRQTLRAAIGRLESEGLLQPRQGSGITVRDWRRTGSMVLLPTWMKQGGVDDWAPLLSMRRAVVVDAIATACAVFTDRELRDLDTLSQALMVEADSEVLARGTLEFIRQIFRIAKNLPAELWFNTVAEVVQADEPVRGCMFADVAVVQGYFPAIVALLRARDVGHARDAARSILEQWDAQTMAGLTRTLD